MPVHVFTKDLDKGLFLPQDTDIVSISSLKHVLTALLGSVIRINLHEGYVVELGNELASPGSTVGHATTLWSPSI